jgi:acyl carrier protein
MTPQDTLHRLSRIVSETLDLDDFTLQPWMTAADVDGWDSLTNVQIVVAIEKEFGVRFSTGDIATMRSVADLVDRTRARLATRA